MSKFLDYMNDSKIERLEMLPGVSRAFAERITAARPFENDEDLMRVNGIGPKVLENLQQAVEQGAGEPSEASESLVSAEDEPPTAPEYPQESQPMPEPEPLPARVPAPAPEPPMGAEKRNKKPAQGFWMRLLRVLLVLALILGCLAAVGAGVYYGSPYLYQRFVQPVEQNASYIDQIATRQASDQVALSTRLVELQTRLDLLTGRMDAAEQTIQDHTAAIAQLESMQALLDENLGTQREGVMVELKFQVMTLRSMELLSRARLFLSQSNFGVARQDVAAAREIILQMSAVTPVENLPALNAVLDRLDKVLLNLPEFPVIAANDLEIAWQLLLDGLPNLPPTPTLTPEPPTATPEPSQTPIPLLTPEAELTPTVQP